MAIIKKLSPKELERELDTIAAPIRNVATEKQTNLAQDISNDQKEIHNIESSHVQAPSYYGDAEDETPSPTGKFQTLEFASSVQLISFFDKNINEGVVTLHPWQRETSSNICAAKPTSKKPFKFALCACNGSGKDAFVIAPFAIWFCCTKIKSRCIITSSSGVQLSSQTENYIRELAIKLNEYFTQEYGGPIFRINQRFIKCLLSGSEIRLFATDEEGKAEGYHPIEPNAEFCIIVNEAKASLQKFIARLGAAQDITIG